MLTSLPSATASEVLNTEPTHRHDKTADMNYTAKYKIIY